MVIEINIAVTEKMKCSTFIVISLQTLNEKVSIVGLRNCRLFSLCQSPVYGEVWFSVEFTLGVCHSVLVKKKKKKRQIQSQINNFFLASEKILGHRYLCITTFLIFDFFTKDTKL